MAKASNSTSVVNDLRQISIAPRGRALNQLIYRAQSSGLKKASMHTVRSERPSDQPLSFVFPFTPQQIQYTNMSPELSEIQRPGKMPLIAFNRYRARQLSFRFLIAVPLDGMFIEVDSSIEFLQTMASQGKTVYFTNLDRQITNPLVSGDSQRIFWSITDLTFSSIRRNEGNEITAAEANITLVENVNPKIKAAELPKLAYTSAPPAQNRPSGNKNREADFGPTWSQTEAGLVSLT